MYSLISAIRASFWQEFLHDATKSCTVKLIKGAAICPSRAWTPLSPGNIFHYFFPPITYTLLDIPDLEYVQGAGREWRGKKEGFCRSTEIQPLCLIWWAVRQSCPGALCQRDELSTTTKIPLFANISSPSFALGCSVETRSFLEKPG